MRVSASPGSSERRCKSAVWTSAGEELVVCPPVIFGGEFGMRKTAMPLPNWLHAQLKQIFSLIIKCFVYNHIEYLSSEGAEE